MHKFRSWPGRVAASASNSRGILSYTATLRRAAGGSWEWFPRGERHFLWIQPPPKLPPSCLTVLTYAFSPLFRAADARVRIVGGEVVCCVLRTASRSSGRCLKQEILASGGCEEGGGSRFAAFLCTQIKRPRLLSRRRTARPRGIRSWRTSESGRRAPMGAHADRGSTFGPAQSPPAAA